LRKADPASLSADAAVELLNHLVEKAKE